MAFNVKLMPLKVIDGLWEPLGAPNFGTDDSSRGHPLRGGSGAKVLNMSIGRTVGRRRPSSRTPSYAGPGAFVAIAGGNEFRRRQSGARLAEICARINGVMAVAADRRNKGPARTRAPAAMSSWWRREATVAPRV